MINVATDESDRVVSGGCWQWSNGSGLEFVEDVPSRGPYVPPEPSRGTARRIILARGGRLRSRRALTERAMWEGGDGIE